MNNTILVTGASGNLGSNVVRALSEKGFAVRAASRQPEKLPRQDGVTPLRFDYEDRDTYAAALAGVDGVVLIAPPLDPTAPDKLLPFIDAAETAGVKHLVFNSAFGADYSDQNPLRVIEKAVIASGIPYAIIRPNFFMDNFTAGAVAAMIAESGTFFIPADDAKTSFIAARDIAAAIAAIFAGGLTGKEFNLTGPEALDHHQVAATIGAAIGKPVTYQPIPEEMMAQGLRAAGMPESAVTYMSVLYGAVRGGFTAPVTGDLEKLTGAEPTRFAAFAGDAAGAWR